jgi:hypothetical protein
MGASVEAPLSVLLHAMPAMLKEIVASAALSDPHVELIEAASGRPAAAGTRVDVVLSVCPDPRDRAVAMHLLAEWLASGVVLMTPSGRHAVIYEVTATPVLAADLSATDLLRTIRLRFSGSSTAM